MSFMKLFGKGKSKKEKEEVRFRSRSPSQNRKSIHFAEFGPDKLPACYQSVGKKYTRGPKSCPGDVVSENSRSAGGRSVFDDRGNKSTYIGRHERHDIDSPQEMSFHFSRANRSEKRKDYRSNYDVSRFEDENEQSVDELRTTVRYLEGKYKQFKSDNRRLKMDQMRLNEENERLKMEKERTESQFNDLFNENKENMIEMRKLRKELEELRNGKSQWDHPFAVPSSFPSQYSARSSIIDRSHCQGTETPSTIDSSMGSASQVNHHLSTPSQSPFFSLPPSYHSS